jgi:hypothetical protein
MITPESTDTAPDASTPARGWVWHSTDESIATGQISVLSVVETFCALGLYGWLAFHFEHQWWWLLIAVATPIILFRSPASIQLGLKIIKLNFDHNAESISYIISIIILTLFTYYFFNEFFYKKPLFISSIFGDYILNLLLVMVFGFIFGSSINISNGLNLSLHKIHITNNVIFFFTHHFSYNNTACNLSIKDSINVRNYFKLNYHTIFDFKL